MTTDTGISDIGNSDTGDSSATNTKRGVVDWFNFEHGFGFIVPEKGGPSVFVHFTEIAGNGIYHSLQDGDIVTYEQDRASHPPQARNVRITGVAGTGNNRHPNRVRPVARPFRLPR
ncbi:MULTISPECIES: cold-shock protein [Rhodococcus]|jgi:CspA family cold shock protein|uniref:cold-shock protein n=1 Tax=Rhodococcus TaxID=1827 RepID=UPI0027DF437C|nr:cold shock domain-containing protein [Rhodococcus globerulus]MCE4267670.1 cold shock domain-containing protein [Rhodococcus globerulus]